jgi:hypothetical protein
MGQTSAIVGVAVSRDGSVCGGVAVTSAVSDHSHAVLTIAAAY